PATPAASATAARGHGEDEHETCKDQTGAHHRPDPTSGPLLPCAAVTSGVQAPADEPSLFLLVPRVEEVRVTPVLTPGGELEAGTAEHRVLHDQLDRGDGDRVALRAAAADHVGHVALVVGAVQVLAVPAA